MRPHVVWAIFSRNFFAYFSNPTGYVFICGFVLVTGFAAFWPHEFFNANLANLDQLNTYLPFIMLGFVPAITMSVWSEERRQGTDELLLTMPAGDFDVVAGKYMAAVAIFTVSLCFSLTNLLVLILLGNPDVGLVISSYLGYWLVGLTMLSIGMVASFLTNNLTVGFVLGVALNAPLVIADWANNVFTGYGLTMWIKRWSIASHFEDLSNGVVSLASFVYFFAIIFLMLYLSMVLIGRRHWATGEQGFQRGFHYTIRAVSITLAVIGLCWLLAAHPLVRLDVTSEKLSKLSPKTLELLKGLDGDFHAKIEAYISPESQIPESYVQTRLNLLNALNEIEIASDGKISVIVNETESYKPEATIAKRRFNIEGQLLTTRQRGQLKASQIYLGVAVLRGLDKEIIPFFDRGVPTEYELVRAIVSLDTQTKKKTLGIVHTDANLMGRQSPQQMQSRQPPPPPWALVGELAKTYDIKPVDLTRPLAQKYDALLVVQPSSLAQAQLDNLVKAIEGGQPTAIFEDPASWRNRSISGTMDQKQMQFVRGQMMPPPPKSEMAALWKLLGVTIPSKPLLDDEGKPVQNMMGKFQYESFVIRQNYNPFPIIDFFPDEFVFLGRGSGNPNAFNAKSKITSGLQHMLLICSGYFEIDPKSSMKVKILASTSKRSSTVSSDGLLVRGAQDNRFGLKPFRTKVESKKEYPVAVQVTGKIKDKDINVVLGADLDMLSDLFFHFRQQGTDPDAGMVLDVDNVTFILNAIDTLAGEKRFVDIRNRRRQHRTLKRFEKITEASRDKVLSAIEDYEKQYQDTIKANAEQAQKSLEKKFSKGQLSQSEMWDEIGTARAAMAEVKKNTQARLGRQRDAKINQEKANLDLEVRKMQNSFKRFAVFTPPIFPLLVGFIIFWVRRSRELKGAVQSRLR
jgi:ABC-2 type transport system permease protein